MAIINSRIVRCKAIINAPFATVGLIDVATNQTIETVRGNATRFQFAFYTANGTLANLSNVSSINLKIQPSQLPEGVSLADKTIPASELDLTTTDATWTNGTKQQAQFIFSNAEMNLAMTEVKKNFWLVVTAILTTGEEVTLAGGSIVWHEDNNATVGSPPLNPGPPLSIEQGDARYEALPLRRTAPPTQGVLGTPATGLVSVASIPTAGQGIMITGDSGPVYVVFGPGEGQLPIPASEEAAAQAIVTALNSWGEVTATRTGYTVHITTVRAGALFPYAVLGGALWPKVGETLQGGNPNVEGTPGIVGQRALVTQTSGGNTVTTTWLCTNTAPFTWMREVNIHGGNLLYGSHEIDGTLWVKNNALVSGNLTVGGQMECHTVQAAATSNSAMTRGLCDGRYSPIIPTENQIVRDMVKRVDVWFGDSAVVSGGTISVSAAGRMCDALIDNVTDGHVSRVVQFAYSHGSINYPEGGWLVVGFSARIRGADSFAYIGNYSPADAVNSSRTSPYLHTLAASSEGRWFVQIRQTPGLGEQMLSARIVSRDTHNANYVETPWVNIPATGSLSYETPLYFLIRIGSGTAPDTRSITVRCVRGQARRPPIHFTQIEDSTLIGTSGIVSISYPSQIRVGLVTPTAAQETVMRFHNPQFQAY